MAQKNYLQDNDSSSQSNSRPSTQPGLIIHYSFFVLFNLFI